MESIDYNQLFRFNEIYPTAQEFIDFVNDISEETPQFDLNKLYDAMSREYKLDGLKHSTFEDFEQDFAITWNNNVYRLNREFELLVLDYDYFKGKLTERDVTETIDDVLTRDISRTVAEDTTDAINRDVVSTEYENPQFNALEQDATSKVETDDDSNRTLDRDVSTTEDDNTVRDFDRTLSEDVKESDLSVNEQIEAYLSIYRRFNYSKIVKLFEGLFLEVLIIR